MALRINFNQAALGALGHLGRTQATLEQAVGRLSTGLRINRAADDAAGLAVSEKLRNQVRGLNQAHRNAQDAVSLLQVAEGAFAETHGLLSRMRELAVQSANDTLTSNDRAHIQAEVNQLVSEVDRIAQSTQYNNVAILNKNSAVTLHASGDAMQFHVGANTNLVSGAPSAASGDNAIQFSVPAARAQDLGDVKTLKQIDATITSGTFVITGTGAGTITYDATVDTVFDVRDLINAQTATTGVTASVTGGRLALASTVASALTSFTVADGTGNVATKLGIPATFSQGSVAGTALVSAVSTASAGSFYVTDGSNVGTVAYTPTMTLDQLAAAIQVAIRTLPAEGAATVTVTGAGAFEFGGIVGTSGAGNEVQIDPSAPAAFGLPASPLAAGTNTGTAMASVIASGQSNAIASGVTSLVSGTGGTVVVGSQSSANAAISLLDAAITNVSSSRGTIGALQNRLLSAMSGLGVASENTAAANSRIRDADIAQAVSEMTRAQILQQATMAVLAQANQAPMSVVQLLK